MPPPCSGGCGCGMSTSAIAGSELAKSWEALGDDGYYAFNDVHALMAFLATGDQRQVDRIVDGLEAAARRPDTNGMMSREVGLPVARALCAIERQDYEITIDELQRARAFANRFGGSHAQRDLLQLTATEAAVRAGRRSLATRTHRRAAGAETAESLQPAAAHARAESLAADEAFALRDRRCTPSAPGHGAIP